MHGGVECLPRTATVSPSTEYIEASASRNRWSMSSSDPPVVMPTLTPIDRSCSVNGVSPSACTRRSATSAAATRVGLLEEHAELVTAEAGESVLCSQARAHPRRGDLQQLVADVVTAGVVDVLEAIQVEVEHRERPAATPRAILRVADSVHEERAVRQTRQRIVVGLALQIGPSSF